MKLCYQYLAISLNLSSTSNHLHPLQVGSCDSNSQLVVDEDDNGKFRVERLERVTYVSSLSQYGNSSPVWPT